MNTILQPIAMTKVDWNQYIKTFQEFLNESPTRGLDAASIPLTDPSAFLASLSFDNKPVENLRQGIIRNNTFDHFMLGMLSLIDIDFYVQLTSQTHLRIIYKEVRRQYLCLISGTMTEWHDAIIRGCDKDCTNPNLRSFMNLVLETFERIGFKEVWSSYEKIQHFDGTFFLRRIN